MKNLRHSLAKFIKPKGKQAFLSGLTEFSYLLDVGCGNNSVLGVKNILPNCKYVGIDIADYNQSTTALTAMDRYIIADPDFFAESIHEIETLFDAVICSHNLEHVNDPKAVLIAMISKIKPGGQIYLSFPTAESVNFPSRSGTLNYYDDETHNNCPPDLSNVIQILSDAGLIVSFKVARYQPPLLRLIGFLFEPISRLRKKVYMGTWELYGFETIIHAKKM